MSSEPTLQPPLTTWNLFFSASTYERGEPGSWNAVEDLASLVDLVCLQDRIAVIGDRRRRPFDAHEPRLFDAIRRSGVLEVQGLNEAESAHAITVSQKHALMFFGARALPKIESWMSEAFSLNEFRDLTRRPTMNLTVRTKTPLQLADIRPGALATLLDDSGNWNVRTFATRTFMYYGCADVMKRTLVPDAARHGFARVITNREQRWLTQAANTATTSWREFPATGRLLRRRLSPFTAVLLERCGDEVQRLPDELFALRDELEPFRQRVRQMEMTALYESRTKALRVERQWTDILKELERAYGPSPGVITVESGITLASDVAALGDDPRDWAKWLSSAGGLIRRMRARRTMVRLLNLRNEMYGAARVLHRVQQLYPTLTVED